MQSNCSSAAWIDVYQAHKQPLFLVALAITGRRELAEDAVHDAFASLYARRRRVRNAKTYAFQAVRNSARMIVRNRHRAGEPAASVPLPDEDLISAESDPVATYAEQHETQDELRRALLQLNDTQCEVIVMHIHADLTFHEIATILQRPLGTVVSQYRRGIEGIRQSMSRSRCHE